MNAIFFALFCLKKVATMDDRNSLLANKNDSSESLFVCQPGQRVSWIALYHLLEVRRGRTLNITVSYYRSDITSPPLTNVL